MSRIDARLAIALSVAALLVTAAAAGEPRHYPRGQADDRTRFQITLRTGEFEPDGESDLWDENVDLYGLTPGGAGDWTLGMDFGTALGDHLEVLVGFDHYSGEDSSYRFEDTDGIPIVLSNRLEITPVTVSLKFAPLGRYSHSGQFRRLIPYLGGGAGIYFWDYEESGDFIDPVTDEVFSGVAAADGAAFGTHFFLGLEVPITPYWSVLLEGRRSWVDDDLGSLFEGFGEFDLSGKALTVGASFRF